MRAHLRLRLSEPVAVHVEHVVVHPTTRPRLIALGGQRRRIGLKAASSAIAIDETLASVWILQRQNNHDGFFEHLGNTRVAARRQQVVRRQQRCIRCSGFVAVDGVREPHDGRHRLDDRSTFTLTKTPRISELTHGVLDLIETRDVFLAADHTVNELAPFPALTVLEGAHALRGRR